MSFEKPYAGLRVVDMSQGVAGPYCAMLLARHGAEVIKIEPPEGDWARSLGPQYGDHTAYSVPANLGKRSIVIDLKQAAGRAIVERMIPSADVFLESFRPGVIDRLGFAYARLKAINPGLVYLSVSGFGQVRTARRQTGHGPDPAGLHRLHVGEQGGGPAAAPHADHHHRHVDRALRAAGGGGGALCQGRRRPGRRIEASLMESGANLQAIRMMSAYREGQVIMAAPPSGTYLTRDGWIQVGAVKEHEYKGLCKATGLAELADDPRFVTGQLRQGHGAYLTARFTAVFATRTAAEWREVLTAAALQNEVVQSYADFVDHPHTKATGLISWTLQPGSDRPWAVPNPPGTAKLVPGTPEAHAPRLGEHTRAILAELGYSGAEIAALVSEKTVAVAA